MSWVKLDDQFAQHPKVVQVGPLAAWLYVCGLTYSARYLTDGFIPGRQVPLLADFSDFEELGNAPQAEQLAERLVEADLWERVEHGYLIHDYHEYNPTREKVLSERADAKARMDKVRKNGTARSAEQTANKSRSSASPSPSPSPSPSVLPFPAAIPSSSANAEGIAHPRAKPRGRLEKNGQETPDRYDRVVELLKKWGGAAYAIRGDARKNRAAVNACDADVELLAEGYWRLRKGEWPDEVVQRQGSLAAVVANIGGYEYWKSDDGVVA